MTRETPGITIRPYTDSDLPEVLDLLGLSLGKGPTGIRNRHFFEWKHVHNPFGRSLMLVAEIQSRIVGFRAFMRWTFVAGDRTLRAARPVDTATHPRYQGRGIFSRLTREAIDRIREDTDLVYNTPNQASLPGYLKMGWSIVGQIPIRVRIKRPYRFVRGIRSLNSSPEEIGPAHELEAADTGLLSDDRRLGELLNAVKKTHPNRLQTPRTPSYLRWRYRDAPGLGYRMMQESLGGTLGAIVIFRIRPRGRLVEATVSELLVTEPDDGLARGLLNRMIRSVPVDHLTCHFPKGSTADRAASRSWFLPSPSGMTLVSNSLRRDTGPSPLDLGSWALSLGDVEVF